MTASIANKLPSTNRLGHKIFNLVIGVQIPLGVPQEALIASQISESSVHDFLITLCH